MRDASIPEDRPAAGSNPAAGRRNHPRSGRTRPGRERPQGQSPLAGGRQAGCSRPEGMPIRNRCTGDMPDRSIMHSLFSFVRTQDATDCDEEKHSRAEHNAASCPPGTSACGAAPRVWGAIHSPQRSTPKHGKPTLISYAGWKDLAHDAAHAGICRGTLHNLHRITIIIKLPQHAAGRRLGEEHSQRLQDRVDLSWIALMRIEMNRWTRAD
jgi:hypothetical protein